MLVLSRKNRESVIVGGGGGFQGLLKVTVLDVIGGKVRLGFETDAAIPVHRLEIWERLRASGELDNRGESREGLHVQSSRELNSI